MKRRDSLLRLKRFRVDELKRRLATLDEMKNDLERKLADLGRLAFPSFLQSIDVRRKNIRTTMSDLERERAAHQDDLAAAFQDLKSFELAEEERLRRAVESENRAAQSRIDEMAIVRHLRKHANRHA